MSGSVERAGLPEHAAPHRGRVALPLLWFGLFGAPIAWALQLISNYALMAHFCYPQATPEAAPTFGGVRAIAILISAILLVVGVAALIASLYAWRATKDERRILATSAHHETAEIGEGRTRFMAISGTVVSAIFVWAVIMAGVPLVAMPICVF